MKEYVTLSLETHLFFGRIMKEHSLFLLAGFPTKETALIQRADRFREEFEDGLRRTVKLADGIVSEAVLSSGEAVTEFTEKAECQIITSEKNRHGELGKYVESISHSMSLQNKKIVYFNAYIWGL